MLFCGRTSNLVQLLNLVLYVTLHNVEIFTHLLDDGLERVGFVLRIDRIELPFLLADVVERYVSPETARDVYGVVVTGSIDDDSLAVDNSATAALRERMAAV